MEFQIETILKESDFFSFLDHEKIQELSRRLELVTFEKNDIVFTQAESSDCFYLVVRGLLCALLPFQGGQEKIIGYVISGQTVGEMGLLATQPRVMTVKAVRQSVLLKITNEVFDQFFYKDAHLLTQLIRLISRRYSNAIEVLVNKQHLMNMMLIPANESVDIKSFVNSLKNVITLHDNIEFYYASDCLKYRNNLSQLHKIFDEHSHSKQLLIFVIDVYDEIILKFFNDYTDKIMLIGQGNTNPLLLPWVKEILNNMDYKHSKKTLILTYHRGESPRNTSLWLQESKFSSYHHIRLNELDDFSMLLRFCVGKAVGLVLGGGGGLGWIHVGAIKALIEKQITIDAVGGTSIGAIVGSLFLQHGDYDELFKAFFCIMKTMGKPFSFRNMTYPIVSLLSGKNGTTVLQEVFGDNLIENLPKPFFCVSSNSNRAKEVIHTQGKLWKWNRASGSVPWLLPPLVHHHEIHIDGGIMNNLPVDVMRTFLGGKGKVIAIDLGALVYDDTKYNFPPILPFWKAFAYKWLGMKNDYHFPVVFDALIRTLLLGSKNKVLENEKLADILIKPGLKNFPTISDANIKKSEELVRIGYEATIKQLKNQSLS